MIFGLAPILFLQALSGFVISTSSFTLPHRRHQCRRYVSDYRQDHAYFVNPTSLQTSSIDDAIDIDDKTQITKTKSAIATKLVDEVDSDCTSLLPEKTFNLYYRIHCTLTLLRKYFPTLLDLPPISTSMAQQWIYDSNVTITGPKGEQLAVGIDEVMGITRALAVVTTAARRAGSLFDMAVTGNREGVDTLSNGVDCELIMDAENHYQILVLWRTRLPQPSLSSTDKQYTEISGRSTVELSRETGRVSNLQIQKVKINGVTIIESLGSALATIRSTARSSPLFETLSGTASSVGSSSSGNPFLDGILSGIRDVVQAVDTLPSAEDGAACTGSPLYIFPHTYWKNVSFPALNTSSEADFSTPVEIDQYASDHIPVLGSESFVEYAILHEALASFERYGLDQLAGSSADSDTNDIRALFSSDAKLDSATGSNSEAYTTLLKGSAVADLYRSLALFRQSSGSDWKIKRTDIELAERSLTVSWESKSPLKVEGADKFTFQKPRLTTSSNRLPLTSDGDKAEIVEACERFFDGNDASYLRIERIENLNLTVGGVAADSEWANSFIAAALRTAGNSPIPDPTISELLRALANRQSTPKKSTSQKKVTPPTTMPLLEDAAAASFYNILRSLHFDLANVGNADTTSSIPAGAYVADDIELRGLLRERLVSGSQGYSRLIGVAISSLRAAIKTGRVRLAAPPKPTIEVTTKGSIRVDFLLALWIDAPTFGTRPGGFGVPLKIQLVCEYVVGDNGKIVEHIILESRLNGVLTPGDVFSRWIKGLTSSTSDQVELLDSNGMPAALEQLVGALNWVKSMQNRGKKN
ncbi:hypothetical protein ACHAXN_009796 [Cyclotella atomus]